MSDEERFRYALSVLIGVAMQQAQASDSSLQEGSVMFIGKSQGEAQRYIVTVTQESTEAPHGTVH